MADKFRFVKDVYDGFTAYAVYGASGIETGFLMQWDTGARKAVPMTTTPSGAIFLGVSEETTPLAGLGSAANPLTGNMLRIKANGIHRMKTTNGETYAHLDAVYMGADAHTVSKAGLRIIGRVYLPDGTTVAGSATAEVPVNIFGSLGTFNNGL